MKKFTSVKDVSNVDELVEDALKLKRDPYSHKELGKNKTLGVIFLNPSLRTFISTQKAAMNLGMNVIVNDINKNSWKLEMQDGAVMDSDRVEHIKEAARVMGEYFDILALRSFPELISREDDYNENIINSFIEHSKVPFVSLESGTRHPLQSLADLMTIRELAPKGRKPKVVLTWAPHVKPLPQSVANSFAEWMNKSDVEFVITHPEGYELSEEFTKETKIIYDQKEALKDADFIYVKNWSSYNDYGKILSTDSNWMLTKDSLKVTRNAKVLHCLPVRRGVELSREILDSPNSAVIQEAGNRTYAAQAVLKKILESNLH